MPEQAPSGPGPLIWVVILSAAVAGALWGIPAGIGVFLGVTVLFILIGAVLAKTQKSPEHKRVQQLRDEYRRKYGEDLPPLTDEMRGVFDRMTGRQSTPSRAAARVSEPRATAHLPQRLVPPAGHHLPAAAALADMTDAIGAAPDTRTRVEVFITRCFDYAVHCDAREWGPPQAREHASRLFSATLPAEALSQLQAVADEAVRLGYRAATPLDLSVILGQQPNESWKSELQQLVGRGRNCAQTG